MATPFFGKRDNEIPTTGVRPGSGNGYPGSGAAVSGPQGMNRSSAAEVGASSSFPPVPAGAGQEGGSKLTVGPNIKLKGVEITDCDTLVVEGMVEATMNSRVIQIAEQGAFKGSAEIEIAEIRGEFNGNLTVRQKLVIYATGRVTGTIRYGKLVVEEGGQLSGDIVFGAQGSSTQAGTMAKPGLQVA